MRTGRATRQDAIEAIQDRRQRGKLTPGRPYRVVHNSIEVWIEIWAETTATQLPQEDQVSTIAEPLNIPREALIGRLQEVADEAKAKREEAEAAQAASRQALLDVVAKLTPDQVANFIHHVGYAECNAVEEIQSWVDNQRFASKPLVPTFVETTVERTIRVLNLASDNTVKVQPNDEIYAYL